MLVSPISVLEFIQLLQKCVSPTFLRKIAVANSGGPDSMCLLFLLSKAAKLVETEEEPTAGDKTPGLFIRPSSIYSIHVNHDMQPANAEMSQKVSALTARLQVHNRQCKVPWGMPPFPVRPAPGQAFEEIARDARSNLISKEMMTRGVKCIAYGHHSDDQVETVLMRLMRGSGPLGASGMKRIRRWGMGSDNPSDLAYAGLSGMQRIIIRPFLEIPKSRILATCEANGIDYVTDLSNFQPEATFRNYIRKYLASSEHFVDGKSATLTGAVVSDGHSPGPKSLPPSSQAIAVQDAVRKLQMMTSTSDLRQAVRRTAVEQERLDSRTLYHYADIKLVSPHSTYAFCSDMLQDVNDPTVRALFVRRILRTVSPKSWGTPAAEAYGRHSSLERIVSTLLDTSVPSEARKKFSAGAKVLWTPIAVCETGELRMKPHVRDEDEFPGWLAHREPPTITDRNTLTIYLDLAKLRRSARHDFLYDNRFRISIDFDALPMRLQHDDTIAVFPTTPWYLPSVQWRKKGSLDFKVLCEYPPLSTANMFSTRAAPNSASVPGVQISTIRPWGPY